MSAPHPVQKALETDAPVHPHDPVEAVVPAIPIVLPVVGAALMFLLAFIAIYLA